MTDSLFNGEQFETKLPARRFPLEPLLKMYDNQSDSLAAALGVSQRTVQRWAETGISFLQADELACRVGENAMNLWPDWLEDDPIDGAIDTIDAYWPEEGKHE